MKRKPYLSDRSDTEWGIIAPLFPVPTKLGRPRTHALRDIGNAICSVIRTGCPWRFLPQECPCWQTVSSSFRIWRLNGFWEQLNARFRAQGRRHQGRNEHPRAASIESQPIKTTRVGGPRGYDGGKRSSGRTRHRLVDTIGLVLRANLHRADSQDRAAGALLMGNANGQFPRIAHVWADQGYTGSGKTWIQEHVTWAVTIVQHPPQPRGAWVPMAT